MRSKLFFLRVSAKNKAYIKFISLFISNLPVKLTIHTNGIFDIKVSLSAIAAVKGVFNKPTCSATVYAPMYAVKIVFPGSGTNSMGFGPVSVKAKSAFHNFPAVLQFLHCASII
jgi:hypothetical protein